MRFYLLIHVLGFTGVTVQANGWIGGSLNDLSEFHMPDVSYLSLSFAQNRQETTSVVPDKDSTEADFLLYDSLTALGAVAVTDVPGFAEARLKALTGWSKLGCVCLGREFSLPDGTTRHTVAASSFGQFGPAVSSLHNVPPLQFADDHATDNKLRQACSEVVADLRLAVARASRDIFDSLDRTMRTVRYRETGARYGLPAMASPTHVWHNLTQLVDAGLFLDHLHSYSLTSEPKHTTTGQDNVATGQDKVATGGGAATYSQQTLPLHTDDGLFIAMTAGLYTAGPDEPFPGQLAPAPTDQCGLYMQLNDGPVVRALFEDGALLILAGQGAADWLFAPAAPGRPTRAARFRPVPHALVANGGHGRTRRNWYGRMFLPPMEARLPSGLSFAVYRERNAYLLSQQRSNKPEAEAAAATTTTRSTLPGLSELQAAAARSHGPARSEEQQQKIGENLPLLPVGCAEPDYLVAVRPHPPARQSVFEYVRPRDRVYVADGAQCTDYNGQAGIYCWTVCVSTANLQCGQQAECVDFTQNNKPVDGTEMCPTEPHESSCGAICIGVSGGNGSGANSSGGTGTSLGANSNDFCTGLNGVSMLMDGFTWVSASKENLCINLLFTQWTLDSRAKFIVACFGMAALAIAIEWVSVARQRLYKHPRVTRLSPRRQRALQAAVHGLHGCLGYFLMLGAMTYAGELFLALLLGLSAGYFLMHPPAAKPPASAEPCCQIYQDSDDEAELQQVHQDVSAAVPPANSTSLADLATTTSTTATQTPTTKTATHTPTTKTAAVTDGVASYGGTAQNGAHHGSGAVHNGNGAAHNDRETAEQEKKSSALSDTLPLQLSLDSATTLPLQTLPQHNPHRPGSLTQSSRQSNETTQPAPSSSSSSSSKSDISLTSMRATRRSQSRTRTQSRHRTRTKSCCENEECNHRDNEERNHQAPHPNEGNESSEFTPPTLVVHEAPLPT